jgi:hypothetical protein
VISHHNIWKKELLPYPNEKKVHTLNENGETANFVFLEDLRCVCMKWKSEVISLSELSP